MNEAQMNEDIRKVYEQMKQEASEQPFSQVEAGVNQYRRGLERAVRAIQEAFPYLAQPSPAERPPNLFDIELTVRCPSNWRTHDVRAWIGKQLTEGELATVHVSRHDAKACPWISVKDRLPEKSHTVLMTCAHDHSFGVQFGHYLGNAHGWMLTHGAFTQYAITHWMELPEMPKA